MIYQKINTEEYIQKIREIIPDFVLRKMISHHFTDFSKLDFQTINFIHDEGENNDIFSISQYLLGKEIYKEKLETVFQSIEKGTLVDLGCGMGNWSLAATDVFENVYGVDVSMERLSLARKIKKKHSIDNVEFIKSEGSRIPFADQTIDAILCFNVLPFIKSSLHEAIFYELSRILKPNGRIYLTSVTFGTFPYLLFQSLSHFNFKRAGYILFLSVKAFLFTIKLLERPHAWCNEAYIRKLCKKVNLQIKFKGYEGDYTSSKGNRIFKKTFFLFPFMKEYILTK